MTEGEKEKAFCWGRAPVFAAYLLQEMEAGMKSCRLSVTDSTSRGLSDNNNPNSSWTEGWFWVSRENGPIHCIKAFSARVQEPAEFPAAHPNQLREAETSRSRGNRRSVNIWFYSSWNTWSMAGPVTQIHVLEYIPSVRKPATGSCLFLCLTAGRIKLTSQQFVCNNLQRWKKII